MSAPATLVPFCGNGPHICLSQLVLRHACTRARTTHTRYTHYTHAHAHTHTLHTNARAHTHTENTKSARLAMLWKINNNIVHTDLIQSKLLPLSKRQRGHDQQFVQIQCRTQCRQFSFLPRSIREWNELPPEALAARTLDTFVSSQLAQVTPVAF